MNLTLILPLYPRILDRTNFLTIETSPLLPIESFKERPNMGNTLEVNERVADVATVFEVYRQVKEVVAVFEMHVYGFQHEFLCVFVGNVADHDGRFCAFVYVGEVYIVFGSVLDAHVVSFAF